MILIDSKFKLGQEVYLKTDIDQYKRLVTGICVRLTGTNYELSCGSNSSWHYDFEILEEKDVLITSNN